MTDKEKLDAIRAEIHRLVDVRGYDREMANDLFAFMDSLPNEPVSEDLEEAVENYAPDFSNSIASKAAVDAVRDAFKAGAKWQKEKDEEEKVLIYKHGFNDCKEQMMTKAIDAEIFEIPDNNYSLYEHTHLELFVEPDTLEKNGFKDNDKVKVIVIKED